MWRARLSLLVALALPGTARGAFHEVTGAAVNDTGNSALTSAMTDVGGVPHVVWEELNPSGKIELHVARLQASSWSQLGGSLASWSTSIGTPSITSVGGVPQVGWHQTNSSPPLEDARVARWTGSSWAGVGSPPSLAAVPGDVTYDPRLVGVDKFICLSPPCSYPEVAFGEEASGGGTFSIHAAYLNDSASWTQIGGPITSGSHLVRDTQLVQQSGFGGQTFVAWLDQAANLTHVARYDVIGPPAWSDTTPAGLTRQAGGVDEAPSMADVSDAGGDHVYVAWSERDGMHQAIQVARFNYDPNTDTGVWATVGDPVSLSSYAVSQPSLASVGGVPWLAWEESPQGDTPYGIHIARFDGTKWITVGGALNHDPSKSAGSPFLASIGGVPYVSWTEVVQNGPTTFYDELRIARYVAPTCSSTSINVAHDTPAVVRLTCSDGAGDVLRIASEPGHGQLSSIDQADGTVTYTPTSGYAGSDSLTYVGNDGAKDSPVATISLTVESGSRPTGGAGGTGGTTRRASLNNLTITPSTFRAATHGGSIIVSKGKMSRSRPPIGALVTFTLSAATNVAFRVEARRVGTMKGRACVVAGRAARAALGPGRARKRCATYVRVPGAFTVRGAEGANRFSFSGRMSGRALVAGRYRLVATLSSGSTTHVAFGIAPRSLPAR